MPEIPTKPESLLDDEAESFEVGGAASPEDFAFKEAPSIGTKLTSGSANSNLVINVVIPLGMLAIAGIIVLILGTVQPEQRPPADTSRAGRLKALPAVRVMPVESLDASGAQLELRVDGSVVPFREAQVAAEVAGKIVFKAPECEAGSFVKKDQLLMSIDRTDYELEVQRLTRMRDQEYQALNEVDQEMVNARRLIEVANQDVALQEKEVERQMALPDGFSSRAEIDQAKRAVLQARQQQVTMQNQLELLGKKRVRLEASERLAATQLKSAEIDLQRTEIRAPIDGVIAREDAELNNFVARGNPLVTIEDTSKVEVATSLRMDQLYWVLDQKHHQTDEASRGYDLPETDAVIEYEMSGRDGAVYRWNGRLLSYDGIGLDPTTRTVPVRVVVDNPRQYVDPNGEVKSTVGPTALVRGMYVQVNLLIKPKTPLVVIPAQALKPGNRVWQFVPDESVLDVPASDPEQTDEETAKVAQASKDVDDSETKEEVEDSFDAEQWKAGKVVVRVNVTPVDSLSSGGQSDRRTDQFTESLSQEDRKWVCEVRGQAIANGSFVVVSPLGSVDSNDVPARAEKKTLGSPKGVGAMAESKSMEENR